MQATTSRLQDHMKPSDEQQAAIDSTSQSNLIIAGPGSGKTATTIQRIKRDIADGVPEDKMVAITFTKAGANELRERLGQFHGFVGTLHSFALESLPYIAKAGYRRGITVLDDVVSTGLLKEIMKRNRIKDTITNVRANVLLPVPSTRTPGGIAATAYRQALRAMNAVDYDTILSEFLRYMLDDGGPRPLAVYVDEFQDSSLTDLEIYSKLWTGARRWVVGDADQSIYTYRGARPENMLELMDSDEWAKWRLRNNYRSRPAIVDCANRLVKHNRRGVGGGVAMDQSSPGKITVTEHPSSPIETTAVAAEVATSLAVNTGDTCAVLCRFNAQLGPIVDALLFAGVEVIRQPDERERATLEKWRNVAAYFGAPDDYVANVGFAVASGIFESLEMIGHPKLPGNIKARLSILKIADGMEPGEVLHRLGWSAADISNFRNHWLVDWATTAANIAAALEPPQGRVHVGTMHSAKGKEFDRVWIVGAEQETTPKNKEREEKEEDRRLFYVAATRPRKALNISFSRQIKDGWKPTLIRAVASQFIQEMGI